MDLQKFVLQLVPINFKKVSLTEDIAMWRIRQHAEFYVREALKNGPLFSVGTVA